MYLKIFVASKTKCIFVKERIYIDTNNENILVDTILRIGKALA